MAVYRTQAKSDLERKLKLLEYQLYGKKPEQLGTIQKIKVSEFQINRNSDISGTPSYSKPSGNSKSIQTDITYLKQDLTKVATIASLAVAAQIILYFSSRFNFLRLF